MHAAELPARPRTEGEPPPCLMKVRSNGKLISRKAPLKVALARGKALHFLLEALVFPVMEHVSLLWKLSSHALEGAVIRRIALEKKFCALNPHGVARIDRQPKNARLLRAFLRSGIPLKGKFRRIVAQCSQAVPDARSHTGPVAPLDGDGVEPEGLELRADIFLELALEPGKLVTEIRRFRRKRSTKKDRQSKRAKANHSRIPWQMGRGMSLLILTSRIAPLPRTRPAQSFPKEKAPGNEPTPFLYCNAAWAADHPNGQAFAAGLA